MPEQSILEPVQWTSEEDAILAKYWPNPDMDYNDIAKRLPTHRSTGSIQHRGSKIGLGPKARHKKARKPSKKAMAWPKDMPRFEDHPLASGPGSRLKAARIGRRIEVASRGMEFSPTGSSLGGSSLHGALADD